MALEREAAECVTTDEVRRTGTAEHAGRTDERHAGGSERIDQLVGLTTRAGFLAEEDRAPGGAADTVTGGGARDDGVDGAGGEGDAHKPRVGRALLVALDDVRWLRAVGPERDLVEVRWSDPGRHDTGLEALGERHELLGRCLRGGEVDRRQRRARERFGDAEQILGLAGELRVPRDTKIVAHYRSCRDGADGEHTENGGEAGSLAFVH